MCSRERLVTRRTRDPCRRAWPDTRGDWRTVDPRQHGFGANRAVLPAVRYTSRAHFGSRATPASCEGQCASFLPKRTMSAGEQAEIRSLLRTGLGDRARTADLQASMHSCCLTDDAVPDAP